MGVNNELPINALLIDVRSPEEFASGHIDGAISLPLDRLSQSIHDRASDKEISIVVYCRSGARSTSAKKILTGMGYKKVSNGGGIGGLARKLKRQIQRKQ